MAGVQRRSRVLRAVAAHHPVQRLRARRVLIAGVLAVQSNRVGLVDERLTGIQEQAADRRRARWRNTPPIEDSHGIAGEPGRSRCCAS